MAEAMDRNPGIISHFDWKGSDNRHTDYDRCFIIISHFDWKGSDNYRQINDFSAVIISHFDWKGRRLKYIVQYFY